MPPELGLREVAPKQNEFSFDNHNLFHLARVVNGLTDPVRLLPQFKQIFASTNLTELIQMLLAWRKVLFPRFGVSLLEVLVSIAIVSLLLSILVVGIQAARETARRFKCIDNLRQIGIALHQYEAQFNCFPSGGGRSYLYRSLPFMERANFTEVVDLFDAYPVDAFQCPSDAVKDSVYLAQRIQPGTNYVGNSGVWNADSEFDGLFGYFAQVRPSDITDGLSRTGMVSELLRADNSLSRLRVNWNTPISFSRGGIDAFDRYCRSAPPKPSLSGWKGDVFARGTPWSKGNIGFTLYNHVSSPGSCTLGERLIV